MLSSVLKPWYVFRPMQGVRRIVRSLRPPRDPVQVVALPWGCELEIDIRETVGRSVWTTGLYDLAVAEVLDRTAAPSLLALDVGANIGSMTGLLAARAAEVWAFEPYPPVVERLRRNVARFTGARGFAPCEVFASALSDAEREAVMGLPEGFAENQGIARITGSDGAGPRVRTARLDSLLGGRSVGVMKLDVEGHELAVLRGAAAALAAGRIHNIVFEDHTGPGGPVGELLRGFGYTVFGIGWAMRGPVLAPAGATAHRPYEAPSYLAARSPDIGAAFRPRGWRCLSGRPASRGPAGRSGSEPDGDR